MSRIWVISPYDYTAPEIWERVWNYNLKNKIISVGWNKLKNISGLSKDQIIDLYHRKYVHATNRQASSNASTIYKFLHDIEVGHTIIARRGCKIIAGIGKVIGTAYYDPKKHAGVYPAGGQYPYHIDVKWDRDQSEILFPKQVFGIQAVHGITNDRYLKIMGSVVEDTGLKSIYPDESLSDLHLQEGGSKRVVVNAYERNRRARKICISIHGLRCNVCQMLFEEVYGDIGKDFIHVHHLKSIASHIGPYKLNPSTDLRPVCPNCHAMLHSSCPPLSIEELKQLCKDR